MGRRTVKISFKINVKYYTINVVNFGCGRDISVTAPAEFGHGVGAVGVCGIPEQLGGSFLVICENVGLALGQNRAASPDIPAYSPQTGLCLFALFFPGILFLTNRTL